jgi:hypothetical protein
VENGSGREYAGDMKPQVQVVYDENIPDGAMVGHDEYDDVIVAVEYAPIFRYVTGCAADEDFVRTWHVSAGYVRRLAALQAWARLGWACGGNA